MESLKTQLAAITEPICRPRVIFYCNEISLKRHQAWPATVGKVAALDNVPLVPKVVDLVLHCWICLRSATDAIRQEPHRNLKSEPLVDHLSKLRMSQCSSVLVEVPSLPRHKIPDGEAQYHITVGHVSSFTSRVAPGGQAPTCRGLNTLFLL